MPQKIELPRYLCHKEVWALRIADISTGHSHDDGTKFAVLTPEERIYGFIEVSEDYIEKHKPIVGGYYIVYKDGYLSFSPQEAFEEDYTRI